MLRDLWKYRYFIINSITNEFLTSFSRSKFGRLWMLINPIARVTIYAFALSNLIMAKLPDINHKYSYTIYLMAGMLGWSLFHDIVSRSLNIFVEYRNLIKNLNFPKVTLPCIIIGSNIINNILLFLVTISLFYLISHEISLTAIWILPLTILMIMLSISIGMLLGIINIFFRDLYQVVPIVLQVLLWTTPIIYPINIIPVSYQHWLTYNPLYGLITAYQNVLVYGVSPQLQSLTIPFLTMLVSLTLAILLYRRLYNEMIDII